MKFAVIVDRFGWRKVHSCIDVLEGVWTLASAEAGRHLTANYRRNDYEN